MEFDIPTTVKIASYTGAGLCIGLGAIGAALGEGYTAGMANQGLSQKPEQSGDIMKNMLVGQAVAQTPSIFGLLVSFILMFKAFPESASLKASAALLGAGLCMGFGGIGPEVSTNRLRTGVT